MSNKGKVVRRETLAGAVWKDQSIVTSQTLAQHIKNLRSKLGRLGDRIETIETIGYKFREK